MIQVVILAAGQGKRMQSSLPKVLHCLAGKSLLEHVIQTAKQISEQPPIIIIGHKGQIIRDHFSHEAITWVEQKEQLGTGHALLQALPILKNDQQILILCGDVPLIQVETLKRLIAGTQKNSIGLITAHLTHPFGYGRIIRTHHEVTKIVEEKDATDEERKIKEINPSIYLIPANFLREHLPKINNQNAQKEFYLTDLIAAAALESKQIFTAHPNHVEEILGINDKLQLAAMERVYQRQHAEQLLRQGVTLADPARVDIRGEIIVGRDVFIDINVVLEGRVVLGNHVRIGANTILKNTQLGDNVEIKPFSLLDGVEVGEESVVGPFARLRPGSHLSAHVHIGNFVEIKNSTIGKATKINHLSYIGDSELGQRVNIGAGTITCNYDGANKHRTVIGDYVHIGSDTQLIAPVMIGEGSTIAAGSTITKDVPANQLTLTQRIEQRSLKNWHRPKKKTEYSSG